ncbi:M4 family metallopeptidase [Ornithinimicrobium sp. Y1847]|uniref:M4 family metallopeptidase n=1 Tax=Ornithinimicrobium sp. Y1847 TaxID=3405419 RepID=UPI003B66DBBB
MTGKPQPHCAIVPPYLLARLAEADPEVAPAAEFTLQDGSQIRMRRELRATRWPGGRPPRGEGGGAVTGGDGLTDPDGRPDDPPLPPWSLHGIVGPGTLDRRSRLLPGTAPGIRVDAAPDRSIHDAQQGTSLPGLLVRAEGGDATGDRSADEAYDGVGATWDVLARVYRRDSLDGAGLPLIATVHYGRDYDNAFWDGRQMVFGDGDGVYFAGFTSSVDVIAHELGHGLTQHTAGLTYVGQSGALNESVSDVLGAIVRQWVLGETVEQADWLIGAGVFTDRVQGVALRSMAAPGTAYDDPMIGTDPQPGHMDDYVVLPHDADHDNGGVHINSGIPNKAFHLFATALGGRVWERAGQVWFDTLTTRGLLPRDVDFVGFAAATLRSAADRYGAGSDVEFALRQAWGAVGLGTSGS